MPGAVAALPLTDEAEFVFCQNLGSPRLMGFEIRLADQAGWRELPGDWDAKRVLNLADREWVELGENAWCRATAVVEIRGITMDAPTPSTDAESVPSVS